MHSKRLPTRERSPILKVCGLSYCLVLSLPGLALGQGKEGNKDHGAVFFGGRDLDFWREGKRVPPVVPGALPAPKSTPNADLGSSLPPPSGSIIRQRDALPFDWSRYEHPSNPEFWDDGGDYVAPRPLREAVANPTKENLERYVAWQAKRLEVVARFSEALASHALSTSGASASTPSKPSAQAQTRDTAVPSALPAVRWNEVEILYFYQSSCPHCQAEKEHIESLARQGARVSFIQLDAGERPPLHARSIAYTREHSAQFAITATPTWILRRREKVVRLEGEQDDAGLRAKAAGLFARNGPS